jgi:hypothetical protein
MITPSQVTIPLFLSLIELKIEVCTKEGAETELEKSFLNWQSQAFRLPVVHAFICLN